jgi:hypothetical protein
VPRSDLTRATRTLPGSRALRCTRGEVVEGVAAAEIAALCAGPCRPERAAPIAAHERCSRAPEQYTDRARCRTARGPQRDHLVPDARQSSKLDLDPDPSWYGSSRPMRTRQLTATKTPLGGKSSEPPNV